VRSSVRILCFLAAAASGWPEGLSLEWRIPELLLCGSRAAVVSTAFTSQMVSALSGTALFASTPVTPSVEFVTAPTTGNSASFVTTEAGPRTDPPGHPGSGSSSGALIGGIVGGVVGCVVIAAAAVALWTLKLKKGGKSSQSKSHLGNSGSQAETDVYVNNPLRQAP
jgi:hypothetical protein